MFVSDHHLSLGEPQRLRTVVSLAHVLQDLTWSLGVSPLVGSRPGEQGQGKGQGSRVRHGSEVRPTNRSTSAGAELSAISNNCYQKETKQ